MSFLPILPIDSIKDNILSSFESYSNIILKASPGSGKTTRVPLYLLNQFSPQKKIYILEPRRLAAKLAAIQVAASLGEVVGKSVGYIFRYEKVVSSESRIIFLTEGTFLKILSQNPSLDDVGLIILDEFHERHLSTDAALSFITKLQKESRSDLKIIVMSATIEVENLDQYLSHSGKTTTLELVSHRYPLEVTYLANITSIIAAPITKKIRNALEDIIEKEINGDILIFLPGMREMRESKEALAGFCEHHHILCTLLHGDLDSSEQDLALNPASSDYSRKIILSTNIAESSVTIPGIRIVIDSGLQRESSYNFYSGLPELKITKISRASATQRAGRSNREGQGHAFRLYAEQDFDQRPYLQKAEIQKSDLSELYLMALNLFNQALERMPWYETPPESALKNARELLNSINAVNENAITAIGKKILEYPLHPRLGRILVEAEKTSELSFKQVIRFLADFLKEKNTDRFIKLVTPKNFSVNRANAKSIELEELLLKGFPDRLARARGEKYFDVVTANGENLKISREITQEFDPTHPLWIVMDLNNKGEVSKIVPVEEIWLYDLEPFPIVEDFKYIWDEKKELVVVTERTSVGKILLSESKSNALTSNPEIKLLLSEMTSQFLKTLENSQEYERLLTLNKLLKNIDLNCEKEQLISEFFNDSNKTHFNQNDKAELAAKFYDQLKNAIDPEGQFQLDYDLPMTIQLSDRRKIPIIYDRTQSPCIESLIQDFYGLSKTPLLAKGKIPLTLKLLGPHKLAIQVTQDLESFWSKTYPQIVVSLKRDYPRHYWPDDPKGAKPILLKRQVPL